MFALVPRPGITATIYPKKSLAHQTGPIAALLLTSRFTAYKALTSTVDQKIIATRPKTPPANCANGVTALSIAAKEICATLAQPRRSAES